MGLNGKMILFAPVLLMAVCAVSVAAFCDGEGETNEVCWSGECGPNLIFEKDNDSRTLTISGTGPMYDWPYPSRAPWYGHLADIRTLVLSEGITHIGNYAFLECDGFTGTLEIPSSVTSIGCNAFQYCTGFTGTLEIPSSVTSIGSSAFYMCKGLTGSPNIPSSVTSIGSCTFYMCDGFNGTLNIPSSVTSVGGSAFYGCTGFTGNLVIPSSVTSIGSCAFSECWGISSITMGDSGQSIGDKAFALGAEDKSVVCMVNDCPDGFLDPYAGDYTTFLYSSAYHSVTYDVHGGTKPAPVQDDVASGSSFTVASYAGTKSGLVLGGWSDGKDTYQPGDTYTMMKSDVTFTAVWTKGHAVHYNLNGGKGSIPVQYAAEDRSFTISDTVPERSGYTFDAWTYNGERYDPGSTMVMGHSDITLKAEWTKYVPAPEEETNGALYVAVIVAVFMALVFVVAIVMNRSPKE